MTKNRVLKEIIREYAAAVEEGDEERARNLREIIMDEAKERRDMSAIMDDDSADQKEPSNSSPTGHYSTE